MSVKAKVAGGAVALLLLCGIAFEVGHEYVRAAAFVSQAAGLDGVVGAIADWQTAPVTEREVRIPWRGGALAGRWYESARREHIPTLLVPGVHASGIDEPRLVGFARHLASVGHPVLTAELTDLKNYAITPRSTDMIEDAARWLSEAGHHADGRITLMGISFAGGLSIVAAGRPAIRARITSVLSFGGHGDLPRTLRYLLTGIQPDGVERPPHDYGVAIILLGVADRVVPTGQVEPLRAAIWSFLEASRLHAIDIARAEDEFARARELAAALPEPAQSYMHLVNARDVARLGPLLLPYITELAGDHALSPARSDAPACPVYLLHGTDDNVIPAVESILLAEDLRKRGTWVDVLLTPLITHADVDRSPTLPEIWRLVTFWGGLLKN